MNFLNLKEEDLNEFSLYKFKYCQNFAIFEF